jgi:hypothetical protein
MATNSSPPGFSLPRNSGTSNFPNEPPPIPALLACDRLAGPGHSSSRDLVFEIARRVNDLGLRFLAYLPCEVNAQSERIHKAFAWEGAEGTAQVEFQKRYTEFIREYSLRYGPFLDGWWFDGALEWDCFHNSKINGPLFLEAARAGNPDAAVTFNDGSLCCGSLREVVPGQDYLAGETEVVIGGKIRGNWGQ